MQLQRGLQFAPGYRLQEFLGRGQFGQVWRASAPGGTAAAVKFIDLSDGQGQKEYDGIRRVKQIRHANLMPITAIWLLDGEGRPIDEAPDEAVQTIDLASAAGSDFSNAVVVPQPDPSWLVVAMLLGGKSLQHRLRECVSEGKQGIPTKELISYVDESAKGLDFLNTAQHDLGDGLVAIQHCDVKPANIVLIGTSAVVCDFGLARILTRSQATATSASGTPAYMAPEAIEGKPSRSSDQYSLAITYYQLRSGVLPVNDGSLWEVLDAHRRGNLSFGRVPEPERHVLKKATSLDWNARFESNVEMVDALREAIRTSASTRVGGLASGSTSPTPLSGQVPDIAVQNQTATELDPSATIGSEFLKSNESRSTPDPVATLDTPPQLFGSPNLAATLSLAAAEASTKHVANDLTLSSQTLSKRVLNQVASRPATSIVGFVVTAGLLTLVGMSLLNSSTDQGSQPSDVVQPEQEQPQLAANDKRPRNSDQESDPVTLLANAKASLAAGDPIEASQSFSAAIALDPTLTELSPITWQQHKGPIAGLRHSFDGNTLLSLADDPFPVAWSIAGLGPGSKPSFHHPALDYGLIQEQALTPHPSRHLLLAGGMNGRVFVWDYSSSSNASPVQLEGHSLDVNAAVWHPSGEYFVTASADPQLGVWRLGKTDNASLSGGAIEKHLFATISDYQSLTFDVTGEWLIALTGTGEIDAFEWKSLKETLDTAAAPQPLRVNAAGDLSRAIHAVMIGDKQPAVVSISDSSTASIWAVGTTTSQLIERVALAGPPVCLQALKSDNALSVAIGTETGEISLLHRKDSTTTRTVKTPLTSIYDLCLSPSGGWLAAAGYNESIVILALDSPSAEPFLLTSPTTTARQVLIDPLEHWLFVGTSDGGIQVWDLAHAKLLSMLPRTESIKRTLGTTVQL